MKHHSCCAMEEVGAILIMYVRVDQHLYYQQHSIILAVVTRNIFPNSLTNDLTLIMLILPNIMAFLRDVRNFLPY